MKQKKISRRSFLMGTAATVATWTVSGNAAGAGKRRVSPNERLNIVVIGCGGRGAANLNGVASENIVALCDVDEGRAAESFSKFRKAKKYHDFRKMLEEMYKEIDAVVVSTPDHTHALAGVMAMKMGKHCYCEKPLAHSVYECRVMAEVAAKKKVATQMGTQIHAGSNFRRVVELIQSGAIGAVHRCHIWLRGAGSAGDRPKDTPPVPKGLHWNLWLGPAPYRPYHPCYVPAGWRHWWDFGGGALGDMGCHYLDLAFWALGLRHPSTVEAQGPPVHPESTPASLTVRYQFLARGNLPPVKLTWTHGRKGPPIWAEKNLPDWAWGVFVGSKGMLLANYSDRKLFPESRRRRDFQPPRPTIPDSIGHHEEWIVACKTGSPTTCNFDYSGAVAEAVLLGNVAYRAGRKLRWDAVNLKATNCSEAAHWIKREYRKGWTL